MLLVLLSLIVPVGPASAHTALVSSAPADTEVLPLPPAQLVLVLTQDVAPLGAEAVVTGGDGAPVAVTGASVDGATVTWALDAAVPAGRYTVRWRVVAADGHPVEGQLSYEATGAGVPDPVTPTEPELTGTTERTGPAVTAGAGPDGPAGPATQVLRGWGGSAVPWVVAALAAAAAATAVLTRRRRSQALR